MRRICQRPRGVRGSAYSAPVARTSNQDGDYKEILLLPLRESAHYTPKFGQGRGVGLTLAAFKDRYGDDPLYSWIGLRVEVHSILDGLLRPS
jgi:hypothetical protein